MKAKNGKELRKPTAHAPARENASQAGQLNSWQDLTTRSIILTLRFSVERRSRTIYLDWDQYPRPGLAPTDLKRLKAVDFQAQPKSLVPERPEQSDREHLGFATILSRLMACSMAASSMYRILQLYDHYKSQNGCAIKKQVVYRGALLTSMSPLSPRLDTKNSARV